MCKLTRHLWLNEREGNGECKRVDCTDTYINGKHTLFYLFCVNKWVYKNAFVWRQKGKMRMLQREGSDSHNDGAVQLAVERGLYES